MDLKHLMDESMSEIKVGDELREEILNQTVRNRRVSGFTRGTRKSVAAAVLCSAILIGSVSVAAMELPKLWDKTVVEMTGVKETVQQKGIQEGIVDIVSEHDAKEGQEITEATSNGVTIRAKQTMTDDYGMYIYLEIEAPENVHLDADKMYFESMEHKLDGKSGYENRSSGFVSDSYAESANKRGYEIFCLNSKETNSSGKLLTLHFENLMSEDVKNPKNEEKTVVAGTWDLQWTVSAADEGQKKVIPLGHSVKTKKGTLTLKQMELFPMSYRIVYDNEKKDTNGGIPYLVSIKMKDGTVYGYTDTGYSLFDGPATATSKYEVQGFWGILDLEQVAAVCIDGTEYPVE